MGRLKTWGKMCETTLTYANARATATTRQRLGLSSVHQRPLTAANPHARSTSQLTMPASMYMCRFTIHFKTFVLLQKKIVVSNIEVVCIRLFLSWCDERHYAESLH